MTVSRAGLGFMVFLFLVFLGVDRFWLGPRLAAWQRLEARNAIAHRTLEEGEGPRGADLKGYVDGFGSDRSSWFEAANGDPAATLSRLIDLSGAEAITVRIEAPVVRKGLVHQSYAVTLHGSYASLIRFVRAVEAGAPLQTVSAFRLVTAVNDPGITMTMTLVMVVPDNRAG